MTAMRLFLCLLAFAAITLSAAEKSETIEGKLIVRGGSLSVLETADHKQIELDGDTETRKVLRDQRLNGMDIHATGHFTAPGKFQLDPQHKRALTVHQHEKEQMITYWCEVCGIRAYSPGPCVCCQAETELQLRDLDNIR
jgi:hypothetical protein